MGRTTIRDLHDDDLDGVVRLHGDAALGNSRPVYALSQVIASCHEDHAAVAAAAERLTSIARL